MEEICIVGGGVSGIVSARLSAIKGLAPVIYEKSPAFGGIWQTDPSMIARWKTLMANLSKYTMTLSDHLWPEDTPLFPSGDQYYDYISSYIIKNDLLKYFQFNTEVIKIDKEGELYKVFTRNAEGNSSRYFKYVIIANGKLCKSRETIKYQERFKGQALFSGYYRDPSQFNGKNVVVVGIGYSGCDLAYEACKTASSVTQIHKNKFVINKRTMNGVPPDINSFTLNLIEKDHPLMYSLSTHSKIIQMMIDSNGNPSTFSPELEITKEEIDSEYISYPIAYDDYFNCIKSGKIKLVQGRAAEYSENGIILNSGLEINADLVVDATGYASNCEFLSDSIKETLDYDPNFDRLPITLFLNCIHPSLPGLGFVGRNFSYFVEHSAELCLKWILGTLNASQEELWRGVNLERDFREESRFATWTYFNSGIMKEFVRYLDMKINWDLLNELKYSKGYFSSVVCFRLLENQDEIITEFVRMIKKDFPELAFD